MLLERGLPHYFNLLTNFGLIPININDEKLLVSSEKNLKICKISYILVQFIIILILFINIYFYMYEVFLDDESPTILLFEIFQDLTICVFQLLLQTWIYIYQEKAFIFIKTIFNCYSKTKCKFFNITVLKNLKILYICIIFYNFNLFSMVLVLTFFGRGYDSTTFDQFDFSIYKFQYPGNFIIILYSFNWKYLFFIENIE